MSSELFQILGCEYIINHCFSAGVQDSALTVHGSLQAQRLAVSLTKTGLCFSNVFSSDLQRACKTANAICLAQTERYRDERETAVKVTALPILREQDFGSFEGKPFSARNDDASKSARGEKGTQIQHQDQDQDYRDVESKESMKERAKAFMVEHVAPIIKQDIGEDTSAIAVVSHGIFLSHLWRDLLRLLPMNSVALSPTIRESGGSGIALDHIGGWSNTGYLELRLQRAEAVSLNQRTPAEIDQSTVSSSVTSLQHGNAGAQHECLDGIKVTIETINGKDHLAGLKRTRGGVGSSKQEEGQTTIETFFKKRKL